MLGKSRLVVPSVKDLWLYPEKSDPVTKYFWFSVVSELMRLLIKRADASKYERHKKDKFRVFVNLKLVYPILYVDYDGDEPIKFEEREPDHVQKISTKLFSEFDKSELKKGHRLLNPLRMYVFHVLLTEQRVFTSDIARRLRRVNKSQISLELTKLADAGYLRQVGVGHYRLADITPVDFLERMVELFDEYVQAFAQESTRNVASIIVHDVRPKDVVTSALLLYLEGKRRKIKDLVENIPIIYGDRYTTVKKVLEFYPHADLEKISQPVRVAKRGSCVGDTLEELVAQGYCMFFEKEGDSYRFADIGMLKIMPPVDSFNAPRP